MEYLAFVDEIGQTLDGGYIYRFDFTEDTDVVWGEYFNVVPSVIIPDLQPDKNCLSTSVKVVFPRKMAIAKKSSCFSMQDCIDDILPLMFSEIDENTLEYEEKPFQLRFGEELEEVEKKINAVKLEMFGRKEVEKGNDAAIDNLIKSMDDEEDEE